MQDHDRGDSMDRATLILATLLSRVPAIRVRATMVHSSGVPGAGIPHSTATELLMTVTRSMPVMLTNCSHYEGGWKTLAASSRTVTETLITCPGPRP